MVNRGLLIVTLALVAPALAAEDDRVIAFRAVAQVSVGTDGQPVRVQAADELPPAIRQFVESTVGGLQFEPAVVDGTALQGTTWVRVAVCAVPRGDDFVLSARYVDHGPGQASGSALISPPAYPSEALRAGVAGSVLVTYTVEPDGSTTLEAIEHLDGNERTQRRYFDRALREWVSGMRYLPEELEGRPVATRLRTPVNFTLGIPASRTQDAEQARLERRASPECMAAERRLPAGQLVSAESPFGLRDPG